MALANLGHYQPEEADEYLNRALEIFKLLGDKQAISNGYSLKGDIHVEMGNIAGALGAYRKALSFLGENSDSKAQIFYNISTTIEFVSASPGDTINNWKKTIMLFRKNFGSL